MGIVQTEPTDTFTTAGGTMTRLATPSRGSTELAVWRVRIELGMSGPLHAIDREQVWVALGGTLTAQLGEETVTVAPGDTLVLPASVMRQVRNDGDTPFEALVSCPAGAHAFLPDGKDVGTPPWIA